MSRLPVPTVEQLRAEAAEAMHSYLRDVDRISLNREKELVMLEHIHVALLAFEERLKRSLYD